MERDQGKIQIGIIGYGKMGRAIEQAAKEAGHFVGPIITNLSGEKDFLSLKTCDVALEFTAPQEALINIKKAANLGVNLVVGTTGWESNLLEVRKIVQDSSIGLLYSPNFSAGMHIFQKMVAYACHHFGALAGFDVGAQETHHSQKKDIPSGSAKALSSTILDAFPSKNKVCFTNDPYSSSPDTLHFSSLRTGSVFGEHTILFDSLDETVTLSHTAKSRAAFAKGALLAASWLKGKKGLYSFDDCLNTYFSE